MPSCSTSCQTNDLQMRPRRSCTSEAGHGTVADFNKQRIKSPSAVGRAGRVASRLVTVCKECWQKTFARGEAAPHFSGNKTHVASGGALSNRTFGCVMRQSMLPACSVGHSSLFYLVPYTSSLALRHRLKRPQEFGAPPASLPLRGGRASVPRFQQNNFIKQATEETSGGVVFYLGFRKVVHPIGARHFFAGVFPDERLGARDNRERDGHNALPHALPRR